MDDLEILKEAEECGIMVAEMLSNVHLPTKIIEQCKEGKLPQDIWSAKRDLDYASRGLTRIVIKIDEWKDELNILEHGELLFKRHMLSLIEAIREMRTSVHEAQNFIRDKTRKPLRDDRPDYLKRDGE